MTHFSDDAWRRTQHAFTRHLEAADRLAKDGRGLMSNIDDFVSTLAPSVTSEGASIDQLFGAPDGSSAPSEPVLVPRTRRVVLE